MGYIQRRYSKYKNIVSIHACSTKTGVNIPELRQIIIEASLKQSFMPEEVPLRYCDFQAKLLSMRDLHKFPTITWQKFSEMAMGSNIDEASIPSVATYFNDLGTIAYFKEVDPSIVIIDPQWITKMFATIITTGGQALFVKNGILNVNDLAHLWKMHPVELHPYMLSLLEQFEVIYRIHNDPLDAVSNENKGAEEGENHLGKLVETEKLFVPCLLDDNPEPTVLASHWSPYHTDETVFGRVYKFDFLFRGFFPLLTVRFLRSNTWEASYYWRNGIILRGKNSEEAGIKARLTLTDDLQLTLYIRGKGESRKQLSSMLSITNTLISDWLKKEAKIFVPCIRCLRYEVLCTLSPCPYLSIYIQIFKCKYRYQFF